MRHRRRASTLAHLAMDLFGSPAGMWPRKRLDVEWSDLLFGMGRTFVPGGDRQALARGVERLWSPAGDAIVTLSVRSGFDLLLSALNLPHGSEVLISAITIPDMVRIIEDHGLVPVPYDLDLESLEPDIEGFHRALSRSSRVALFAPLFGTRSDLGPLVDVARGKGLLVIEDCAQAFAGVDDHGRSGVDVAMFSFGPIKTATALGGAIITVRDAELRARMQALHESYPVQDRGPFRWRVFKYAALKAGSIRWLYGLIARAMRFCGGDFDGWVNSLVKGFAGSEFFGRIRQQPSSPLLAMLERRLRDFRPNALERRATKGRELRELIADRIFCPGARAEAHSSWVFPVMVDDPPSTIARLQRAGFDATQGKSLCVVDPPADRPELEPCAARVAVEKTVYLPFYSQLPSSALQAMAAVMSQEPRRFPPPSQRAAVLHTAAINGAHASVRPRAAAGLEHNAK